MYAKLLAYEIRSRAVADGRSFGAFIAVMAVASGIVAAGLPGISGSTAVLAYALCALTPVACAIAALADYWKTLYGPRGYFTMSLPISGKVIFWAKNTYTVALMIAAQLILAMSWVVQACAAMTIGAEGRFNHLGFGAPIIGFVLVYVVNQVLSTVGTFFLPLSVTTDGHFSTEIMWTSYSATIGTEEYPNVIGIGSYVLVPLFALILGVWASRSIEKHTSLR